MRSLVPAARALNLAGPSGARAVVDEGAGVREARNAVKRKSVVEPGIVKRSRTGRQMCAVPPRLKDQIR